jgi:Glycosyl transferase family 2
MVSEVAGQEVLRPRVSFVVPVHNYGQFVAEAVRSLLAQTYQDLEVIVIDDASTDETPEVLEQFRSDRRVRLVRHERNVGHIRTYNEGLQLASGDFVGLMSADDICLATDAVARQVAMFDSDPSVGFVYSALTFVDESGQIVDECGHLPSDGIREGLDEFRDLVFGNYVPASGPLVRASCHGRIGYYEESLPHSGDWDLWLRLCVHYRVGYIAKPLYGYRIHSVNMHHSTVTPQAADEDHRLTLERAFTTLPGTAPPAVRRLRRRALGKIAVRAADIERKRGRRAAGWARAWRAVAAYPEVLISVDLASTVGKLAALTLLGPDRIARLERLRTRRHVSPYNPTR